MHDTPGERGIGNPLPGTRGGSLPENFLRGQIVGKGQLREQYAQHPFSGLTEPLANPDETLSLSCVTSGMVPA